MLITFRIAEDRERLLGAPDLCTLSLRTMPAVGERRKFPPGLRRYQVVHVQPDVAIAYVVRAVAGLEPAP